MNNTVIIKRLAFIIRESHYTAQRIMLMFAIIILSITILFLNTFKTNSIILNIFIIILNLGIAFSMRKFWIFHMKFYKEFMLKLKDLYKSSDGENK